MISSKYFTQYWQKYQNCLTEKTLMANIFVTEFSANSMKTFRENSLKGKYSKFVLYCYSLSDLSVLDLYKHTLNLLNFFINKKINYF